MPKIFCTCKHGPRVNDTGDEGDRTVGYRVKYFRVAAYAYHDHTCHGRLLIKYDAHFSYTFATRNVLTPSRCAPLGWNLVEIFMANNVHVTYNYIIQVCK